MTSPDSAVSNRLAGNAGCEQRAPSSPARTHNADGLTIVEIMVSLVILAGGIAALSSVSMFTSLGNQQASACTYMVDRAQALMETIKGTAPAAVAVAFDGTLIPLTDEANDDGVWFEDGTILIDVDSTDPKLLVVTVTCTWTIGNNSELFRLRSEIYNPGGV